MTLTRKHKSTLTLSSLWAPDEIYYTFRIGGIFFGPERCRLTDSVYEELMDVKCFAHLTDL